MIKSEIKKGITGRGFAAALAIGLLMMIGCEIWLMEYVSNFDPRDIDLANNKHGVLMADISFLQVWMGNDVFSPFGLTFYMVFFPLVAALPFAASYLQEKNSGYYIYPVSKVGRKKYFFAKTVATFLLGGMAVSIPSIVSLIIALMKYPILYLPSEMSQSGVSGIDFMGKLYFENPLLYALAYILVDFVIGGLIACISMACSLMTDNTFSVIVIPMIINMLVVEILNYVPSNIAKILFYFPYCLVTPSGAGQVTWKHMATTIPIMLFICIVAYRKLRRKDIL